MYICVCNAITEKQVRSSVDSGAQSLSDLQYELGVATCCGRCAEMACEYLPGGRQSSICAPRHLPAHAAAPSPTPVAAQPAANGQRVIMIAAA
jgi:bacterioferritin-associated ferredoxin